MRVERAGVMALSALPTNSQIRSIFALLLGLCASVFVLVIPNRDDNADMAVERNSFAASE